MGLTRLRLRNALVSSLMLLNSLHMVESLPQKRSEILANVRIMTPATSRDVARATAGVLHMDLETGGRVSSQPFVTQSQVASPEVTAKLLAPDPLVAAQSGAASIEDAVNPFLPVATGAPPSQITTRDNHPVPRLNIVPQEAPLHTNKFYANLFLGSQRQPVWTHPYSVSWSGGNGSISSWGLAISHIEASQRAYGEPDANITGSPVSSIINPTGIQSLIISAAELSNDTTLTTDSLDTFSVNANLLPSLDSKSSIKFPLVQGMGFVTGTYTNLQPIIESGIFISTLTPADSPSTGTSKYQIKTANDKAWLMYVIPTDGKEPSFSLDSQTRITGPQGFSGTIQIAKNPNGSDGETTIDASAGSWPTNATLSGSVTGNSGSYSLTWGLGGDSSKPLLMYALPHHQASFDNSTKSTLTSLVLATTTKGNATAVAANSWTLLEADLPTFGFAPWSTNNGTNTNLPSQAMAAIAAAAQSDVGQDMSAQSNINSFYYAGKALDKFAHVIWVAKNLAKATDAAATGLEKLKAAFSVFTENKNQFPLVYETSWKGVVSAAWNDSGADFGNSFYNDHHFHFGYFLHAAAMLGDLDPEWLEGNREYINIMVRDTSNPSREDGYFPVFRSFDWYHGHSWAKGLFESGDGKDEESSSEDVMYAYGLKMWGNTIKDASMEARGNLMLAVMRRSLNSYFLLASDNKIQPENFIGNKVTGILFENKIDHVTYFGANPEYVQGIHMIPLTSASVYTRPKAFVQEEWDTYFAENASTPASKVQGGWKGILYANQGLIDPHASYEYFSGDGFDEGSLDGGASRTWYLALAAGLGGAGV